MIKIGLIGYGRYGKELLVEAVAELRNRAERGWVHGDDGDGRGGNG